MAMKSLAMKMDGPTRRQVVARAAQTFLGVSLLPRFLAAEESAAVALPQARADHVIYIYLTGGMSHLDTLDPKPGAEVQGPTLAIETNVPGIWLSEHFSSTAKLMDKVTLVRSLTSTQGNHERGQYFMHTSYNPLATTVHPSLGSWVAKLAGRINPTLPGNVLIGRGGVHPGAGFMESKYAPLPIGDPNQGLANSAPPRGVKETDFQRRMSLAEQFDRRFVTAHPHKLVHAYNDFYDDAVRLMKSDDLAAFDLTKENPETRDAYGKNNFGQGVLLARRLVEHGTRFIEVNSGGWDTHQDNFERVADKAVELDLALGALLSDLAASGLLKRTLVVVASEFGRTPKINEGNGRDHHPRVFTCLLAGGGVKGGYVHGSSDKNGYEVETDGVKIPDFNATIAHAMGINIEQKVVSPDGRPFTLADKGKPVTAVFA